MMLVFFFSLMAVAVVTAWLLASRRPEHRAVAVLLTFGLLADVGTHLFDVGVIVPLREALGVQTPWTGWARVAAVVYNALVLAWPTALVATVIHVFTKRAPAIAIVGWALVVAFFSIVHPTTGSQQLALTLANSLAAFVAAGIVVHSFLNTKKPASSAQFALALVSFAEVSSLLGAWRIGPFENWPISQVLYLALFGVLAVAQGRFLWFSQPQPSL